MHLCYILIILFVVVVVSSIITGLHSVSTRSQSQFVLVGQYMLENLQWLVYCFLYFTTMLAKHPFMDYISASGNKLHFRAFLSCYFIVTYFGNVGHPFIGWDWERPKRALMSGIYIYLTFLPRLTVRLMCK